MLIGGAVREAALLGYHVTPLFSYYSYHGPVFRVMLRVHRGKLHEDRLFLHLEFDSKGIEFWLCCVSNWSCFVSFNCRNYGFVTHCNLCGHSHTLRFDELGLMGCPCSDTKASSSLVVSGPMWLGPLHDASYVTEMLELAKEWGWVSEGTGMDLDKLLSIMIEESDPRLPPGYTKMDEVL